MTSSTLALTRLTLLLLLLLFFSSFTSAYGDDTDDDDTDNHFDSGDNVRIRLDGLETGLFSAGSAAPGSGSLDDEPKLIGANVCTKQEA